MTRGIGYYVHHQGEGHWQRAKAIGRALPRPCTFLGTFDVSAGHAPGPLLALPDDRLDGGFSGADGEASRPEALHYAPLGHVGIQARMAAITDWIVRTDPVLMIVDVSVEVAMLARLLSVPTLVVRLAGDRSDPAHIEAFRSAERLIAPFPEPLDATGIPGWVRTKTIYVGFLAEPGRSISPLHDDGRIIVLLGRGGGPRRLADVAAAARAVPDRVWDVLGEVEDTEQVEHPANLRLHGWVEDVAARLSSAGLVVGAAGDGVVAAIAAAGKRFVCLPEPRPYGEQVAKAQALGRLGAAVIHDRWPEAGEWPGLLARAAALDPAIIGRLADHHAARRLADEIEAIARSLEGRRGLG